MYNESKNNMNLEHERKIADLQSRVTSLENLCYSTKEVLNLEEASIYLGISRSMLYKMTHNGDVPYYKPAGKLIFFEKTHLLEWVRQNQIMCKSDARAAADLKMAELNRVASSSSTMVPDAAH